MEKKVRYKLHKVKKQWVTIAVTALSVVGLGVAVDSPTVSADTTDAATVVVNPVQDQANSSSDQAVVTEKTVSTADVSANQGTNQVTDNQNQGVVTSSDKSASAQDSVANDVSATPTTDNQVTTDNQASQTDINSQVVPSDSAKQQDQTNAQQVVSADAASKASQEQAATALTNEVEKASVTEDGAKAAALSLDNVKLIGDSYYYVEEDGMVKKNFAITVNGQLLYFDNQTGALTSTSTYSFTEGLTNQTDDFTSHNKAYDSSAKSFETVDNYLTADSWYRPAYILKNGETWVESTATDFRPLLMAWWPDKDTQLNYVNYMSKALNIDSSYTEKTDQATLNQASKNIQIKLEQKIAAQNSTKWLRDVMSSFVTKQSAWNKDTESVGTDHLQGGALLYVNSDLTQWANSDYRLLNRTATRQDGTVHYDQGGDTTGGYDFLLANDVDNSNPVVQAEQLNQLHYLMNWGSIVMKDSKANFDGVRVDAVDNVNADLLQIYTNYFESYYGVNKSEAQALAHISILEAWSNNDPVYNQDTNGAALAIDNYLRLSYLYSLTKGLDERSGLEPLITNSYVNRSKVTSYANSNANNGKANYNGQDTSIPSYVFVRAHDSEVQTIIAKIISERINPKTDGYTFTLDELAQAFKIYNDDMNSAQKEYTHYNIPAAYALMLSNIESVPRVYYGDLYTDNGQYMATKSPYYKAIDALLRARIKYAAGGQAMAVNYYTAGKSMTAKSSTTAGSTGILTSVRYGSGVWSANDKASAQSRTQGMATIISNNPNLDLQADQVITVDMGAAHANQAYRPLLLTTADGLQVYPNDADTKQVKYTDANGNLTFTAAEIKGYAVVEVNGYLAVWVPVGAAANQDVRVTANQANYNSGDKTYQTTAALDSQLIYEGFSNFQDFATKDTEYTNKVIAQNVQLFSDWGITSFEMAPQYVSTTDGTFLDSIIQNGYAFDDRYDLAMSQNNKYGSKEDLANALRALHAKGIQVIADWVPDQIYSLTDKEVVTATRVNDYGDPTPGAEINKTLYVANSKSSGKDYQAQYGGIFLDELKAKYPEMFTVNMISTGKPIDSSTKIKMWKAEYFNGTNILGRGARYVLSDNATGTYFTVAAGGEFLPKQLSGDNSVTGFYYDGRGMSYFSTSGYRAKSAFVTEGGYYYYFDKDGYMVTGTVTIDGKSYYFLPNGIQLRDAIYEDKDGNQYYYGSLGNLYKDNYYSFEVTDKNGKDTKWRYFDKNGVMARGIVTVLGVTQYFDKDGYQVKAALITDKDGKLRYFAPNTGAMVVNDFVKVGDNTWYYFGADGVAVTGAQNIKGQALYFDEKGVQAKGVFVTNADGSISYYHADSGQKVLATFFTTGGNNWYYADANGKLVTGYQIINGQRLHFDTKGVQTKGQLITDEAGNKYYYDANSGELVVNKFAEVNGVWYYFGGDGKAVKGEQTINGQHLYFNADGSQVKGQLVTNNGRLSYYDANSGRKAIATFFTTGNNTWYYADASGQPVTGNQVINGQHLHFDAKGVQIKGQLVTDAAGNKYYYDADSGEMAVNKFVEVNGVWYYFGADGKAVTGEQTINGQHLYFNADGSQVKGQLVTNNGRRSYYDANSGEQARNKWVTLPDGTSIFFNARGFAY